MLLLWNLCIVFTNFYFLLRDISSLQTIACFADGRSQMRKCMWYLPSKFKNAGSWTWVGIQLPWLCLRKRLCTCMPIVFRYWGWKVWTRPNPDETRLAVSSVMPATSRALVFVLGFLTEGQTGSIELCVGLGQVYACTVLCRNVTWSSLNYMWELQQPISHYHDSQASWSISGLTAVFKLQTINMLTWLDTNVVQTPEQWMYEAVYLWICKVKKN